LRVVFVEESKTEGNYVTTWQRGYMWRLEDKLNEAVIKTELGIEKLGRQWWRRVLMKGWRSWVTC